MRNDVLLVGLVVVTERIISLFNFQIFGELEIKPCLLGIGISVSVCLEGSWVVGFEDG